MVKIEIQTIFGRERILFTVPLPARPPVFMTTEITSYDNEQSRVVIVDSGKFMNLWRNTSCSYHKDIANGNPKTWLSDYKYQHADDGFSAGHDNPVPLAAISYVQGSKTSTLSNLLTFRTRETSRINFTDGITRTIWLLCQGCSAFPVLCEMPGAVELNVVAGLPDVEIASIDTLYQSFKNPCKKPRH